MDLSVSGEIPITSWFSKKTGPARAAQRPVKRKQTGLDSSPPVKKSKSSASSTKAADERASSSSKKTSIMNYMQVQAAGQTPVPHTPQLKALSRTNACLPTPPDSARLALKPRRVIPALVTPSDTHLKDKSVVTAASDPQPSKVPSSSTCFAASVIEISDDDSEDMFEDSEIPSSRPIEMDDSPPHSPDDFVGSSQSQLLDIFENPSPRKNKRLRNLIALEPTLELIPSSQSQEWDLGTSYHNDGARFNNINTNPRPLNRSLFGSFADVSVHDDSLTDICEELDAMASESASRTMERRTSHNSPSLEVDHDFEGSPDEIQALSQPALSPLNFVADHASNYNSIPSSSSRSPPQVADYQESLPTESLPEEVRDFLDMFGSGDESYPPGFPESLKD